MQTTRLNKACCIGYFLYDFVMFRRPYAVILIVSDCLRLSATPISFVTLCNLKWFFFLVHQSWFLVAPLLMLCADPTTETESKEKLQQLLEKLRTLSQSVRLRGAAGVQGVFKL